MRRSCCRHDDDLLDGGPGEDFSDDVDVTVVDRVEGAAEEAGFFSRVDSFLHNLFRRLKAQVACDREKIVGHWRGKLQQFFGTRMADAEPPGVQHLPWRFDRATAAAV